MNLKIIKDLDLQQVKFYITVCKEKRENALLCNDILHYDLALKELYKRKRELLKN